jgi:hypothetical protein
MPDSQAATYSFRVRILGGFYAPPGARRIWRELELTTDQTLADLGDAIPSPLGSTTRTFGGMPRGCRRGSPANPQGFELVPPSEGSLHDPAVAAKARAVVEVADRCGVSRVAVHGWLRRYASGGPSEAPG